MRDPSRPSFHNPFTLPDDPAHVWATDGRILIRLPQPANLPPYPTGGHRSVCSVLDYSMGYGKPKHKITLPPVASVKALVSGLKDKPKRGDLFSKCSSGVKPAIMLATGEILPFEKRSDLIIAFNPGLLLAAMLIGFDMVEIVRDDSPMILRCSRCPDAIAVIMPMRASVL